ncbi:hypothetical protein GP486_008874, partial [Trichoglossum hirsutum]
MARVEGCEAVALARVGAATTMTEEEEEEEEEESRLDILDAATGDRHIAALRRDGRVFAAGEGTNGQLGTGAAVEFAEEWV